MTKRHRIILMAELFETWPFRDRKLNREYVGGYIGSSVRRLKELRKNLIWFGSLVG